MNYTKGGKPFVKLLLLAPLRDWKGKAKYFLWEGQVDCSALAEGRREWRCLSEEEDAS
jgi:hypothetical protein